MPMTNNLFQLTFPDGWKETTVHTFEGPHDSGVQHNLVLTVVPGIDKDTVLSKYAKEQLAVSTQVLPGFESLSETETKLPSGVPVFIAVYKYSPSDEITYYQKQYFVIQGGKAYTFSSTFSKKTLQTVANEVDQIVATFRAMGMEG